jgi:HAMP domain-containing protein
MSKTQDKKAANIAEAAAFVKERRQIQLAMLKQNFEVGVMLYEQNKDTLSADEIEQLEKMMAEQKAALDKLENELNSSTEA